MKRPNAAQWETARRLFALETHKGESADERAETARRVHEKLFARLAPLIGTAGTRALFARCVRLTAPDFPCVGGVDFDAEPTASPAEKLVTCLRAEAPDRITEATVAVCATMLALLATLIGERLTSQVLKKAWPDFDMSNYKEEK